MYYKIYPAIFFFVAILFVIGLDIITKNYFYMVVNYEVVVNSYFSLVRVFNYGASFGLGAQYKEYANIGLFIFSIIFSFTIAYGVITNHPMIEKAYTGFGMIVGGALGNAIDRIRFGAVFDFIALHYEDWYFPAFNIADAAISIGAVLYIGRVLGKI